MFDNGFFGGLFDFDGDGKLNDWEKAADLGAFIPPIISVRCPGKG